jgi:ADP-sugar diphosphatase
VKVIIHLEDKSGVIYNRTFELRKDVVSILLILKCGNKKYVGVLVLQSREATGYTEFCEIPAGIIDENEKLAGAAIREVSEETGIDISEADLIDLVKEIYGEVSHGIFLAPGTTNDNTGILLAEIEVSEEELRDIQGRVGGATNEQEDTIVRIVPFESAVLELMDAKSLTALMLYHYYLQMR